MHPDTWPQPEPEPLVSNAELDELFAAPQRPRWKIGFGAAVVLALVACAVVVLAVALQPRSSAIPAQADLVSAPPNVTPISAPSTAPSSTPATVLVHVAGAVQSPGVYELASGDRVIDALTAAGGVTGEADPNALNYARPLTDGEQIYVPTVGEAPPPAAAEQDAQGSTGGSGLVNLNTATAGELETLPRIGPAMAQRIIDYRDAHGGFTSVDELQEVPGIGEATFAGLQDLVTVS